MNLDVAALVQAITSLLVITTPPDPVKILVFNKAISNPPRNRVGAAARVAMYVALILGGAALFGRELLELLGINLDAFSVVGGVIITGMGLEMLYGGGPSKAQGGEKRAAGPEEGDHLMVPLTLPLIAGPGAITTAITLSASGGTPNAHIIALIGVGVVAVVAFLSYAFLGELIARAKPASVAIMVRIGGLLLATIGAQMLLGGLQRFFA